MSASQRSFSCCGCESKITYPLTLHCGHIICFNCADALRSEIHQQQQEYSAVCPQCKTTTHTNDIRLLLPQGYENLEGQENQFLVGQDGEENKQQENNQLGDNDDDDDDFEFQQIPEDEENIEPREYEGTWDHGGQQLEMQQQPEQMLQMQQLFKEDQMGQQYTHQISQEQQKSIQFKQDVNVPMDVINKPNLGNVASGRGQDNAANTRQLAQSKSSSSISMTVNNNSANKKLIQKGISRQNYGRDSVNGIASASNNGSQQQQQQQQLITPHYYPQHAKNNANRFKANNHNQILRGGTNVIGSNISNTNNAGLVNNNAEPLIERILSSRVVSNSSNNNNNKKNLLSNSSSYQNNRRGSSNTASVNQIGTNNTSQMNQRFQSQNKNGNNSNSLNHNYVLSQSNNSNFDNQNWNNINQKDGTIRMDPQIDNDLQEQQLQVGGILDQDSERNKDTENILINNNILADDNLIYADSNINNNNNNPWQSSTLTDSENLLEKGLLCKDHNEPVQLYCQEEKELLCVSCLYNSDRHKRHRVAPLKRSLELIRKENNLFKLEATQKLQLINSSFQICSDNRQLLQQSYNPLAELISEQFEQLHVALQNREQQLQNELKSMFTQRLVEYDQILNDLNYLKQCITEYKDCDKYNNNSSSINNNSTATNSNTNQQGTNVVVYIFSIYSMIRSTLKNIDFSFKPLSQQHLNSLLEFKQQGLLGQIQQLGVITSKLNIREQHNSNNTAYSIIPGGSSNVNGTAVDKNKQYQQQQLYQQMKTTSQGQVGVKQNNQISSSVQFQQHQQNYSLPSPSNQVNINNSKSQRNSAQLSEKQQQQHQQLPPQQKGGNSISRNPTPERTSQDDKQTPRQSIASPITLVQNPSNANINSADFNNNNNNNNNNIQSSQVLPQQNVQQFSPVPVQQSEQYSRQNPLTHRASTNNNNPNTAHNSQGCLPNELSTYAQLIVNRSTKFSSKKQQSKQDQQHAKEAQPKCSTPPQNRRINDLVKNMQNVTYYALLEEKYNKRSKSSQKKEQGFK